MLVFKFGGASVKSANAVKNIADIIRLYNDSMVVVVSAMGKTTNALEKVAYSFYYKQPDLQQNTDAVKTYHYEIINELFENKKDSIIDEVNTIFHNFEVLLKNDPSDKFDIDYDWIVAFGEIISSRIVSAYLNKIGIKNKCIDIRNCIKTDNTFREAKVEWNITEELIKNTFTFNDTSLYVTQGFIGSTKNNLTITLGREGSDFSAAIIAYSLNANSVTIWKDVPGVLNADPKWFSETKHLPNISYHEAIELSYYGATVIHPKTLKPLENKKIPLYVKSFKEPLKEGTLINGNSQNDSLIPSFIFRINQVLISISPRDYSFIIEGNLSEIFGAFAQYSVKINLMQNSAISFSACVDNDSNKLPELINNLRLKYKVLYNTDLELVTIRHYDQATIDRVTINKEILLIQKSRKTCRMVMKDISSVKMTPYF